MKAACWSATGLFQKQRPFPYCTAMLARLDTAPRVCKGFPDVFAPEWREHFMQKRYGELAGFNRDFGTEFTEWSQVRGMTADQLPQGEGDLLPMVDFAEHFADRYFSVVSSCIKKHDPNHLYLGCRFVRCMPHKRIVSAAGRYCDVMSVNCYSLWPHEEEFERWYRAAGRPIQLGELGLPGQSHSSVRPCFPVFNDETIGQLVRQSGEKWSKQPWSLGFHWFPHEALTGIQDQPRQPFVDALVHITEHLHEWRGVKEIGPKSP